MYMQAYNFLGFFLFLQGLHFLVVKLKASVPTLERTGRLKLIGLTPNFRFWLACGYSMEGILSISDPSFSNTTNLCFPFFLCHFPLFFWPF